MTEMFTFIINKTNVFEQKRGFIEINHRKSCKKGNNID